MDFALTEIQEMFKNTAKSFFEKEATVTRLHEFEKSDLKYSPELYKELADLGFLGLIIPEKYGGSDGSMMDLAVVIEEMGYGAIPTPLFTTISYGIVPLLKYGTEEQKSELLPKIASGELIISGAISEPNVHYDLKHVATLATKSSDGYSVSGTKAFVPFAQAADYLLTVVRTPEGAVGNNEGFSLLLVKNDPASIKITEIPTMGTDRLDQIEFNNTSVSASEVIGEVGNAWDIIQGIQQIATAIQSVEMSGLLRRALEITNSYVKERHQFNRAIGTYQSVQHRLADMLAIIEGGQLMSLQTMWRLGEDLPIEDEVSRTKAFLSKEGQQVFQGAHQLHGGMGIDMDYPLQFCFRRFKTMQLILGGETVHLKRIADKLHEGTLLGV